MNKPSRIKSVTALDGLRVKLFFVNGTEETVDLRPYLEGPIFEPVRKDPALFRQVRVDEDFGGLEWPNGTDICPEVFLHGCTPVEVGHKRTGRGGNK